MLDRFKICDDFSVCLNQLQQNSKLAVAISNERIRWMRKNSNFEMYCFERPDIIFSFPMTFWIRNNFTYIKELNEFIKAASASGLIERWRSQIGQKISNHIEHATTSDGLIKMENMVGILGLLVLMYVFKICAFISEIVVYEQVRSSSETFRPFWILVEKIIEPKRHFLNENVFVFNDGKIQEY